MNESRYEELIKEGMELCNNEIRCQIAIDKIENRNLIFRFMHRKELDILYRAKKFYHELFLENINQRVALYRGVA